MRLIRLILLKMCSCFAGVLHMSRVDSPKLIQATADDLTDSLMMGNAVGIDVVTVRDDDSDLDDLYMELFGAARPTSSHFQRDLQLPSPDYANLAGVLFEKPIAVQSSQDYLDLREQYGHDEQ